MTAFYNENDRYAAAWLRELIKQGLVTHGVVDERSIVDLQGDDLRGFTRVHLFGGIGGWDYALNLAGWPRSRVVWSGSAPCQPFSAAGKRKGQADERHLWPVFLRLIRECQPATVFGEQVASDDGYRWLARVRDDLEEAGYAVGCADLPACSAGAPHIRQRLFWVADARRAGLREQRSSLAGAARGNQGQRNQRKRVRADSRNGGNTRRLADADGRDAGDGGLQRSGEQRQQPQDGGAGFTAEENERERKRLENLGLTWEEVYGGVRFDGTDEFGFDHVDGLADAAGIVGGSGIDEPWRGQDRRTADRGFSEGIGGMGDTDGAGHQGANGASEPREAARAGPCTDDLGGASHWSASRIILCRDDKYRRVPVEPALFPLAARIPGRVGMLRGAGNSIVPQTAAIFIKAYLETESEI